MKPLRCLLVAVTLATPLLAKEVEARTVTANQIYAAGHNQRPTFTNRPSWQIFHRYSYGPPYGVYGRPYGFYGHPVRHPPAYRYGY